MISEEKNDKIVIYTSKIGETNFEVKLENETVWLNLNQLADFFERDKSVISRHIRNIFLEGELSKDAVVAKNATTAADGKKYNVEYFNLDMILSIGYRVNSQRATQFRIWASKILKEYLVKGYAVNIKKLQEETEAFAELKTAIKFIREKSNFYSTEGKTQALLKIIDDYASGKLSEKKNELKNNQNIAAALVVLTAISDLKDKEGAMRIVMNLLK
ncbi:MAG: RhuM family protein [bacterium]